MNEKKETWREKSERTHPYPFNYEITIRWKTLFKGPKKCRHTVNIRFKTDKNTATRSDLITGCHDSCLANATALGWRPKRWWQLWRTGETKVGFSRLCFTEIDGFTGFEEFEEDYFKRKAEKIERKNHESHNDINR